MTFLGGNGQMADSGPWWGRPGPPPRRCCREPPSSLMVARTLVEIDVVAFHRHHQGLGFLVLVHPHQT